MARKSRGRTSPCARIGGSPKDTFDDRRQAERHAQRQEKIHRTGRCVTAYQCEQCGLWHVGKARSRKNSGGWK